MFIVLLMVVLAVAGIYVARTSNSYGSSLEEYITSRNPQNAGDIERLTTEYHKNNGSFL